MRASTPVRHSTRRPAPCTAASPRNAPPPHHPPPPPRHAAVALDVEYAHYAVEQHNRILRIPAELAVVADDGAALLHARVLAPPRVSSARRVDGGAVGDDAPLTLTLDAAAAALVRLLSAGAVLVGHGVASDARALGVTLPPTTRVVDTAAALARPGAPTPSLDALVRAYVNGEDVQRCTAGGRHSALADARLTMAVYLAAVRGTPADAPGAVEDAAARIVAEFERRKVGWNEGG